MLAAVKLGGGSRVLSRLSVVVNGLEWSKERREDSCVWGREQGEASGRAIGRLCVSLEVRWRC